MNPSRLNAEFNIDSVGASIGASLGKGYRNAAEAGHAANQSIARRVGDALANVVAYFRRGTVMAELNRMDGRELADLGLSHGNLGRVFDTNFAREHARRGR